ncbi:MAG: DUF4266 domain-containing protein [Myxococcota bacterium]|nr:DUF4266 domain-containing protein [Myxococcota bacterium]MDW8363969.1 DUF4266 domain-containing protein [Myxococcales bacterium]
MGCRRFSEAAVRAGAVVCALLACLGAGCATVRPEDREHLARPAMTFGSEGASAEHEDHVLSNREGAFGGGGVGGGGCGCN